MAFNFTIIQCVAIYVVTTVFRFLKPKIWEKYTILFDGKRKCYHLFLKKILAIAIEKAIRFYMCAINKLLFMDLNKKINVKANNVSLIIHFSHFVYKSL